MRLASPALRRGLALPLLIYVDGDQSVLFNPSTAGPFYNPIHRFDVAMTMDPASADCIYTWLGPKHPSWKSVNKELYAEYGHKYVWFGNYDDPSLAYDPKQVGIKVLAQPLRRASANREHRIITCPLVMGHISEPTERDDSFLRRLRQESTRIFTASFIGKTRPAKYRSFLHRYKKMNRADVRIVNRSGFFARADSSKMSMTRQFLKEMSMSMYGFAPRGVGTCSFRLFQLMSVGTVPIISGAMELPYEDEVNWNDMAITAEDHDVNLDILREETDIWYPRHLAAIEFWHKYVRTQNRHIQLTIRIRKELENGRLVRRGQESASTESGDGSLHRDGHLEV